MGGRIERFGLWAARLQEGIAMRCRGYQQRGPTLGPVLVLGLVIAWFSGAAVGPRLNAQPSGNSPVSSSDGGMLSWSTTLPDGSQHLYIIDTRSQAFVVYRVDARDTRGAVKLEAARQFRWDLRLAEFNNQAPEVATIESMVAAPKR
jgi:hypothetical protein